MYIAQHLRYKVTHISINLSALTEFNVVFDTETPYTTTPTKLTYQEKTLDQFT